MATPGMDLKGVTQEEISKLTKAMKSKEFRGHMDEYCKEVSDPGNRKEYLQYLDQLEAKGEMPDGQQLLRCQPGCCVKTWITFKNGQTQKCFINIVHSDRLDDLSMERSDNGDGHQVKLPYSLSPPRPDRDKKDEYCMTCDFAVSSRTFFQAMQYPNYLKMLVDTAADNLASHHLKGNEEVKKDYKVMQKMACKGGFPMPMSVKVDMLRDKGSKPTTPKVKPGADAVTPSELRQMRREAKEKRGGQEQEEEEPAPQAQPSAAEPSAPAPRIRVPQHQLVHSGTIELTDYMEANHVPGPMSSLPKLLRLTVEVPTVKRVGDINLEVTSTNVVVEVPDKYYLDLPLPYEVQDENGSAKFDKAKQVLTLELPVVPKPQSVNPNFCAQPGGSANDDGDGALSEGRADSDEELPPLREEAEEQQQGQGSAPSAPETAVAAAAAPGYPAAAAAPARQLLEFDAEGGPLHVAGPAEEAAAAAEEGPEDLPAFVAAEAFQGARPGYFFGQGEAGLGYHLDKRQPRPGGARPLREVRLPAAPAAGPRPARTASAPSEPLVAEVPDRPASASAATGASAASAQQPAAPQAEARLERQLPPDLQRYVDATAALGSRAAPSPGPAASEELAVEWEQTLQNLMLLVDVPAGHEVADLQLTLRGQRLSLSLCSRASAAPGAAEPAPWRRHHLRRLLCGMVDIRQWHAEPPAGPGEPLVVVLRKVDRGIWAEIFDAKASVVPEPCDSTRDAPAAASRAGAGNADATRSAKPQDPGAASAPGGGEAAVDAEDAPVEDSAELDAVAPAAEEAVGPGAKAVAAQGSGQAATEATIQSAVVMGQGVLIRNRLIYELL